VYRSCLEWSSPRLSARALRQPKKWSPLLRANSIPPWLVYKACLHPFALRKLPISGERPGPLDIYGSARQDIRFMRGHSLRHAVIYRQYAPLSHRTTKSSCARRIRRLELNRLIFYETTVCGDSASEMDCPEVAACRRSVLLCHVLPLRSSRGRFPALILSTRMSQSGRQAPIGPGPDVNGMGKAF
jgi:hypothetical protein